VTTATLTRWPRERFQQKWQRGSLQSNASCRHRLKKSQRLQMPKLRKYLHPGSNISSHSPLRLLSSQDWEMREIRLALSASVAAHWPEHLRWRPIAADRREFFRHRAGIGFFHDSAAATPGIRSAVVLARSHHHDLTGAFAIRTDPVLPKFHLHAKNLRECVLWACEDLI
jgi:hypothetical protein